MKRREFLGLATGATVWPFAVRAQQSPKIARIGLLTEASLESPVLRANFDAIRQKFGQLGYLEGKNITFEERGADALIERLPAMAAELVRLKVDVLVALATQAGRAAQRATNTIPVVIGSMGDPVADGLVASLSRPGGNITGTTFLGPELLPKRLGLLKELIPTISRVVCLWHPEAFSEQTNGDMKKAIEGACSWDMSQRTNLTSSRTPLPRWPAGTSMQCSSFPAQHTLCREGVSSISPNGIGYLRFITPESL